MPDLWHYLILKCVKCWFPHALSEGTPSPRKTQVGCSLGFCHGKTRRSLTAASWASWASCTWRFCLRLENLFDRERIGYPSAQGKLGSGHTRALCPQWSGLVYAFESCDMLCFLGKHLQRHWWFGIVWWVMFVDEDAILSAWGKLAVAFQHLDIEIETVTYWNICRVWLHSGRVTHSQWLRTAVLALLNGNPPPIEVTAKAPFHPFHFIHCH